MDAIQFEEAKRRAHERMNDPPPKANGSAHPNSEVDSWPMLDDAAYHGVIGEAVRLIEPDTEADPVAVLAHLLTFFGNAAGRSAHYEIEGTWHPANLFVALVGTTSRGRKGTAAARAMQIMRMADQDWCDNRIVSGMSTGEGLIHAVRDPVEEEILDKKTKETERIVTDHGVDDKRLCVIEPEFGRVLQVMNRQGNTLSAVLRQAWESGRLQTLTKNSAARASGAMISVVAHITADELVRHLNDSEIANGLANRVAFLACRRSKRLPDGGAATNFGSLAGDLAASLAYAKRAGRVTMDADARELWHEVYASLTDDVPGLMGALTARAAPQVVRLALIYALAARAYQIREEHLSAALALWRYSEASVQLIFGDALGDPIADTILAALRSRKPDSMSRTEISGLFARNAEASRIELALDALLNAGKAVRSVVSQGPGRPTEFWTAA